jgi:hypothetical protein
LDALAQQTTQIFVPTPGEDAGTGERVADKAAPRGEGAAFGEPDANPGRSPASSRRAEMSGEAGLAM